MLSKLGNINRFYEQVKQEANKVSWPTKPELLNSALVVVIAVIIFSVVCLGIDYCINSVVQYLLKIGK